MTYLKILTISVLLSYSKIISAQAFHTDSLKLNAHTKLAAINPYPKGWHNNDSTYQHFNFLLEDSALISEALKGIKIGKERSNYMEMPCANLLLIQDDRISKHLRLNIRENSIMIDGHTYYCDFENIKKLHKKHPVITYQVTKVFKTKELYEAYRAKEITNKDLIFYWPASFRFAGSVTIIFPHNKKFPWTTDVFNYLDNLMKPLAPKTEYAVSYSPEEGVSTEDCKNFEIAISCSKELSDQIITRDATRQSWKPTIEEATFFYKK